MYIIKLLFYLFDTQVQPALTYVSKVWRVKEVKTVEQVHIWRERERENVLPESQQTPNSKIYGKLVQHPLYINNLSTD